MNHRLKHTGADSLTPNYRPTAGAPPTHHGQPGFRNRNAHELDPVAAPLAGASNAVFAPPPTFNQPPRVSFVALSDRIASQTPDQASPSKQVRRAERSGLRLNFNALTTAVRTLRRDPQNLTLALLLTLLAGASVLYLYAG
ncbi:MAG: hypothetical protein HYR56_12565 [Acidobacteria bacterium]|nr:hypothetical protein [Acidobacteriota bacterium]MBI3425212.1 hypothetical protein [Acidobacteriota bacterium]